MVVDPLKFRLWVASGRLLYFRDVLAQIFLLGLEYHDCLLVHKEHVIGRANIRLVFAHSDAKTGIEIDRLFVLHHRARLGEHRINAITGDLFGVFVRRHEQKGEQAPKCIATDQSGKGNTSRMQAHCSCFKTEIIRSPKDCTLEAQHRRGAIKVTRLYWHSQHNRAAMSDTVSENVIEAWLETEAAAAPDCSVVAALKAGTKSMKLDEGAVLKKLRELYKEPQSPLNADVADNTD